jgi:hypothetical protein
MSTAHVAAIAVTLAASTAAAQSGPRPPFATLDKVSGGNRFGVALGFQIFDDSDSDGGIIDDRVGRRLDLDGEYAFGADDGITASLPIAWVPPDASGLGAAQLGAFHRIRLGDADGVFLRGGLVLPTDGFIPDNGYAQAVAVHGTVFQRLEDPAAALDVFWGRTGAVYRHADGPIAVQADLLVDAPLDEDIYVTGVGLLLVVRVGGGLAFVHPPFRVGGELLWCSYPFADLDGFGLDTTFGRSSVIAAAASAGLDLGVMDLFAWFSNPLGDYIRSHVHAFGLGLQASF